MAKGELKIHSQNILPIIKKWLYSEKEIFIRELVSNACDALFKLKVLQTSGTAASSDLRIDITLEKDKIIFSDTGIGMTSEEVEKYIAQIAFSGAEEFVSHYGQDKDQIIGHFGLGFYSAYMVANRVDIDTLSYKEGALAAFWSCDGSTEYTLEPSSKETIGTCITLHVSDEHKEILDKSHFKGLLEHYCRFLPYPIFLDGEHINNEEPLWNKPALDCKDEEYIAFFKKLYPLAEEPLFWVHLQVDYPFNLKGILYFPPLNKDASFKESDIQLFCNRVFVSPRAGDLLPQYLTILKGAIDSPDIPLNVSRSALQMDKTVKQLASHISRKVAERLGHFFEKDRSRYEKAWSHLEVIVKLGVLQDEKFAEKATDFLIWKSSKGGYITLKEYIERCGEKVYYAADKAISPALVELFHAQGKELLISETMIDISLFSYLESRGSYQFQRFDASLDKTLLDESKEDSLLDESGKTAASRLSALARTHLDITDLQIEAKSLASNNLLGVVTIDERERRLRDYMALHQPDMADSLAIKPKKTFVLNTNNPLVKSLEKIESQDPTLAKALLEQMFDLSLLSQKELDAEKLAHFVEKQSQLLEKMAAKFCE